MTSSDAPGLSRRQLLKRGAVLGGAVVWATPIVQLLGLRPAFAQQTSPGCVTYCIKWEVDDNHPSGEVVSCVDAPEEHPLWTDQWTAHGRSAETATCLICPEDALDELPPNISDFRVYGTADEGFWVAYPDTCSLAPVLEPSGDPLNPGSNASAKCGSGVGSCDFAAPFSEEPDPCFPGLTRVFIPACPNGRQVSHLELIVQCCS